MFIKRRILQYSKQKGQQWIAINIAEEEKYTLFLNNKRIVSLYCTPENLEQLAAGFFTVEGLICSNNNFMEIKVDNDSRRVFVYAEQVVNLEDLAGESTITSGCGMGMSFLNSKELNFNINMDYRVNLSQIQNEMKVFQKESLIEKSTGGVHSAAVFLGKEIILKRDVGRHNAVDKIIGCSLLDSFDIQEKPLYLTGRISTEIVLKCAKMNIPMIVSFSSATSLAAQTAEDIGITLIGYMKGSSGYIYSSRQRIINDDINTQ
ncbi:MAG: formate dehydrogenase accessory sulfurtransferase FdhD [Bacillota bacterium]